MLDLAGQGLSPTVVVLTLAAAVLHATWNAVAHATADRLVGFALIGSTYVVIGGAGAIVLGPPPAAAWPYVIASAVIHIGYTLLLLASYELGEFSQSYPLARGTAPWLVAVVSVVVLGRDLPAGQLVGILLISAGLTAIVLLGGGLRERLPALTAAAATGVLIASYTVVDGLGVAQAPVLTYAAWMFLLQGPAMPLLALVRRGSALRGQLRGSLVPGLVGGVVSLAAYGLVLVAQTSGALAPVAALRETSIVVGALIGRLFLGEVMGPRRAWASVVVVAGIAALTLS